MTPQSSFFIHHIKTPLGQMLALAHATALVWLSFETSERSNASLKHFLKKQHAIIKEQPSSVLLQLTNELNEYFHHQRTAFTVPLNPLGTDFQQKVWQGLRSIPYGETRSYRELATQLQHPSAFRAVAMANAANPISLIIPCHRVINHNGKLGGYSGGLEKKVFLLGHENQYCA